jgi:hypothetical protein
MQSSIYNNSSPSPRHHSSPTFRRSRPQQSRSRTSSRGEAIVTSSELVSNSLLRRKMAIDEVTNGSNGEGFPNGTRSTNSEVDKIQRNSLYITFNAPQVDDYVCELISLVSLTQISFFSSGGISLPDSPLPFPFYIFTVHSHFLISLSTAASSSRTRPSTRPRIRTPPSISAELSSTPPMPHQPGTSTNALFVTSPRLTHSFFSTVSAL